MSCADLGTYHTPADDLCGKNTHSKHDTLTQCWANVGPPSTTLSHHEPSIGSKCRACREKSIAALLTRCYLAISGAIKHVDWTNVPPHIPYISIETGLFIEYLDHVDQVSGSNSTYRAYWSWPRSCLLRFPLPKPTLRRVPGALAQSLWRLQLSDLSPISIRKGKSISKFLIEMRENWVTVSCLLMGLVPVHVD